MTRRSFLSSTAAPLAGVALAQPGIAPTTSKMGIASTSFMTVARPKDTYEFMEHCHTLGAGGIQTSINGDPAKIRARAAELGMYIEAMAPLPRNGDAAAFERSVQNGKAVGALCVRAGALSGRRYETFASLADWEKFKAQTFTALKTALPIVEKQQIPLALENHKDWTLVEMLALLKNYSSEYLGVCLDFGNNISLLDDPMEVAEKLAPYTLSTHVKDMGVQPYPDGFLLSEVPLGQGILDLPRFVSLIRKARPKTRFSLEMITRDPLRVPCLTDKYWVTFPDRSGQYLARTLKLVDKRRGAQPLPAISQLPRDEQLRTEEENVKSCLRYAREKLEL